MTSTMAGPGGGEAPVHPVPTKGMGKLRGKGEVATGRRNLTNTRQKVMKGTVHEAEREKGTAAGAGAARAGAAGAGAGPGAGPGAGALAPIGPGVVAGGGQVVETELFIVPNPNKLFLF